jgi:hypothetical protein
MKNGDPQKRCHALITTGDLERLLELAKQDRRQFFARHPGWAEYYADRILGTALCQGAAWHYLRGDVGINDFDVYTFYAANQARPWYSKRLASVDFGDPRFGCSEISSSGFVGRRVDLMGRDLDVLPGTDLGVALKTYLGLARTDTARELSKKAVVLLEPRIGEVVWPVGAHCSP